MSEQITTLKDSPESSETLPAANLMTWKEAWESWQTFVCDGMCNAKSDVCCHEFVWACPGCGERRTTIGESMPDVEKWADGQCDGCFMGYPAENTEETHYVVCGNSEDAGKTIDGAPFILSAVGLAEAQRQASDATGGSWDVVVIHKFTVNRS